MNVQYEDKKLHNDGIFDGFMGYKEWFHYQGTFFVDGKPLNFVLGFVRSYSCWGVLGWISFDGKQFSLAGNIKDKDSYGVYKLRKFDVGFTSRENGYTFQYKTEPEPGSVYTGTVEGEFPEYKMNIKTPDLHIEIEMRINSPEISVYQEEIFEWMPFGKRISCWFHSGDITASMKGTVQGRKVTSGGENRGWYERQWSKVPVLWPSEWLFFMIHLDNGAVFDLYVVRSLGIRVQSLDECWLYENGTFHEFTDYDAHFSPNLKKAIKEKEYSEIVGNRITCSGSKSENSFNVDAVITDFRQYRFCSFYAAIKWNNFVFETEGEATIGGKTIDMKGRGIAEWAPIKYWWL